MATINLIPPRIKKNQQTKRVVSLISTSLFAVLVMLLIVYGAIWATDNFMRNELAISNQSVADAEFKLKSYKDIEDRITSINSKLARLNTLKTQSTDWTDVLQKFDAAVPEKIQITSLQIDSTSTKFTLSGIAPSRREIVMLQTKLEDSDYFSNVAFGSSVLDSTANTFTFSLTGAFKK